MGTAGPRAIEQGFWCDRIEMRISHLVQYSHSIEYGRNPKRGTCFRSALYECSLGSMFICRGEQLQEVRPSFARSGLEQRENGETVFEGLPKDSKEMKSAHHLQNRKPNSRLCVFSRRFPFEQPSVALFRLDFPLIEKQPTIHGGVPSLSPNTCLLNCLLSMKQRQHM